ncbi:PTS transporter subunit EIIC [Vibrio sp. CDRSL-10 TSBA]
MATIRDYAQLAKDILSHVGGQENIISFTRCATRLRLVLKEVPDSAADQIKSLPGVITVVISGGQFQVVIGTHVADVYESLSGLVDQSLLQNSGNKVRIFDAVIASMSAIFAPIIFVLAAAGILQGALIVTRHFAPGVSESGTFAVLNFMSWTPFVFLPVFIAMTAAKHFRCNPFIAVLCSCALINPSWGEIAAQIANGELITFLSIPLAKTVYTASVLPPIFMVWGMSYVERFAKRVIPAVVSELFTPLVCMLVMVPLTLILIGPVTSAAASGIAASYNWLFDTFPPLAAALVGGVWQMIVVFGVHWGITPVVISNFDTYGRDSFQAFQSIAVIAQMAAAFAVGFKSRNKLFKTTSFLSRYYRDLRDYRASAVRCHATSEKTVYVRLYRWCDWRCRHQPVWQLLLRLCGSAWPADDCQRHQSGEPDVLYRPAGGCCDCNCRHHHTGVHDWL